MKEIINKYKSMIVAAIYFLSYGMVMNTLVMNNDSIRRMGGQALENRLKSGRFMIEPYYALVHQNQLNPIISVTILIICYFTAVKLLLKIFDIKSPIAEILVHGLVISYPITTFFFAYGQDSDAYSVAFLLSVVCVYLLKKGGKKNTIFGVIAVAISLGFYQAYITVTVSFLLLTYFFAGKSDWETIKDIIIKLLYVGMGCILYFVLYKLCLVLTGTTLGTYNNANEFSILNMILSLPQNIIISYKEFLDIIMTRSFLFDTEFNNALLNIILLVIYAWYFIKSSDKGLKAVLLLLFVPAMYSAQIITGQFAQYIEFGYLIYLVGAVVIVTSLVETNTFRLKYISGLFIIPTIVVLSQISLTNQIHTKTSILTQESLNLAEKVYFDLAGVDDYQYGDQVYITGNLFDNENLGQNTTYKPFNISNFSKDTSWIPGFREKTVARDWPNLVRILGYDVNAIPDGKYSIADEELTNKPEFPSKGYIYEDENGVFIINMGN